MRILTGDCSRTITCKRLVVFASATALMACTTPTAVEESPADGSVEGEAAGDLQSVLRAVDGLAADERREELIRLAAEAGGTIHLYTSLNAEVANTVQEKFSASFSDQGLELQMYRSSSEAGRERILQEAEASSPQADAIYTDFKALMALSQEGALAEYKSPRVEALEDGSWHGDWTTGSFLAFVATWNSDAVDEPPGSWEELAEDSFNDRLAVERGDFDWYMALTNHWIDQGKSQADIDALWEDIFTNAIVVSGHSHMNKLLAAGEYDLAVPQLSYVVELAISDGAPVAWQPATEPVFLPPNGTAVVGNGPNPAGGLLMVDWFLEEGQDVFADAQIEPALAGNQSLPQDVTTKVIDVEYFFGNRQRLEDEYARLTRLGNEAPSS